MIEYKEALEIILNNAPGPIGVEKLALSQVIGRVLAEDITSDVDLPPFNKSAMDGFAVRADDVKEAPVKLAGVMDVPAGVPAPRAGSAGTRAAFMIT